VGQQKELLGLEREAELQQTAELLQGLPVRALCLRGLALQKLWVSGSKTGLYGRTIVSLVQRNSAEFPAHSITSGDIVGVIKQGDDTLNPDSSGVVVEVRGSSIAVAFQDISQATEFDENHQLVIVKLANDVTYRRLNNALGRLSSLHSDHLADILLGAAQPGEPLQVFAPSILNGVDIGFMNPGLDESQKAAVRFALKQRELGIVHGPPGTGKTTTIVEIILQSVRAGDKVIVSAPSNVAVDNLLDRLVRFGARCIRLGHPARVAGTLQKYSLDALINSSDQSQIVRDIYKEIDEIRSSSGAKKGQTRGFREIKTLRKELKERERKVLKEILASADIVLGTLTSSGADSPLKHLPEDHFSLAVIDECSQALEMACWITVPWSKKLLLAGDHLQLPPTILSKKAEKGLEVTMMERLIDLHGDRVVKMLTTQYRMNKLIMRWSSEALYSGRVTAGPSVADHRLCDLPDVTRSELTETVLLLVDTAGSDMNEFATADGLSKGNEGEARLVCRHVEELISAGVKPSDIAVITPYNLQVEMIRMNLRERHPKVEVRSVDGFQGREKEVVILSMVRSNPSRNLGFLTERRRLNVAVTRARRQVVCICDSDTVSADPFIKKFIDYLSENGSIETPDMYHDLPEVDRPDDRSTSLVANTQQKKPENKSKKKEKKEKKPKQITQTTCDKIQNKGGTPLNVKSIPTYTSSIEKSAIEESLKNKYQLLIQSFMESETGSTDLPSDLNAYERMIVHEVAETFGISHESVGEGMDRHIVLRKASVKPDKANARSAKELKPEDKVEPKVMEKEPRNTTTVTCGSCNKEVPKHNIELHKLRCQIVDLHEGKAVKQETKRKDKGGAKKKKKSPEETEDFDDLCEQFQKMSKVCNFEGCKVKVKLIGADCKLCLVRFCLNHSMAELHGCGPAAKLAARQQIHRDHKIYPGSGTINKNVDPAKRKQLSRILDKKLDSLSDGRKPKKSDK